MGDTEARPFPETWMPRKCPVPAKQATLGTLQTTTNFSFSLSLAPHPCNLSSLPADAHVSPQTPTLREGLFLRSSLPTQRRNLIGGKWEGRLIKVCQTFKSQSARITNDHLQTGNFKKKNKQTKKNERKETRELVRIFRALNLINLERLVLTN